MSQFFLEGQQPLPCLAEQEELRKLLPEMVRFEPTWEELELYKDGGVAIIDQWICAHARCLGSWCLSEVPVAPYSAAGAGGCDRLPPLTPFRKLRCFLNRNTQPTPCFLGLLGTVGLDPAGLLHTSSVPHTQTSSALSVQERGTAQAAGLLAMFVPLKQHRASWGQRPQCRCSRRPGGQLALCRSSVCQVGSGWNVPNVPSRMGNEAESVASPWLQTLRCSECAHRARGLLCARLALLLGFSAVLWPARSPLTPCQHQG